jgi:hypothetical protein
MSVQFERNTQLNSTYVQLQWLAFAHIKNEANLSKPTLPSERRFGSLFTAIFVVLGVYGYFYKGWTAGTSVGWLIASVAVGLVTLLSPRLLAPFNLAWFKLGELMGKVVSPLVLGAIFFMLITPIGLLGRLFGRDELRLKRGVVSTYWIERDPPALSPDSFKNQF